MTTQQRALAEAIYDAIKEKANNLNFVDKMVLMNALKGNHSFDKVPKAQQQLFLEVGMAGLRALQTQGQKEAG